MSSLVLNRNFMVVPKEIEQLFTANVLSSYLDCNRFKKEHITSEINVCDEMIDTLSSIASVEIFEDQHYYKKLDDDNPMTETYESLVAERYDYFMCDVILVFEKMKLSYFCEGSETYHNLPGVGVW